MQMYKKTEKEKKRFCPAAALLFGFLAIMTAADLVNPVRTFSEMENRELKTKSSFTVKRLFDGDFQSRYEEVLADQFIARDGWITLKSISESLLFKTENNGVLYGKNGALFGKCTDYNQSQFEKNAGFIRSFAQREGNVTVGIIPSGYVYSPAQLPLGAGQIDQRAAIADFQAILDETAEWFDADALLTIQESESLFYNTDHHWRGTTAFLAYQALSEQLGRKAFTEEELTLREVSGFYGSYYSKCKKAGSDPDTLTYYDLPFSVRTTVDGEEKDGWYNADGFEARDKYGAFLYGNGGLTVLAREEVSDTPQRLLLIKDSFSNALAPLFLSAFDEVYVVDLRSYPSGMQALCEEMDFDEIVILYNFENIESDTNVYRILQ